MVVPFRIGDIFRPSRAAPDARVLNNMPGCYPVEDWYACYWTVSEDGTLREYAVTLQLPQGYAAVCEPVRVGQAGCVLRVRRWGVSCRISILEAIAFDPAAIAGPDASDEALMEICFAATQFDLPGGFVIADPDYPFLLFDPKGTLKGSSVDGISLLGALAFFASGGRVASDFQRLRREAPSLYRRAVAELTDLLKALSQM
ncbi:MAG: hypothetical protein NZ769_01540 [Anaerolineae bacterium]|nr:hypothetical protein [Anaerolineae bacterium]MCX8066568.1 hypothetical protein [Anaerolineae bacterium]